ncbi:UDP-3-O-[3-hydroxymyristoyl] glucosamine N-acyltransferase [Cognatiyoonia koreensis]|uniref:UDP-3-O-[3-hydroxymyristoyl] glucosamine N-acyltransferase n=1 Tax=Cognatiyoonia koreensis TaxID=364200 RepID=A0A1I0NZK9_9RHOB|nr:UDP-3-O-(3-hydroxymyristoyl)glucosamine N-acyltransferase [Cognatiyoonia koreensis]SEW07436.1 UDP-3-O-[3-hydroxymyristoyl] glucosamine N-acyltransferase [Cognatiyoonia koreensis]
MAQTVKDIAAALGAEAFGAVDLLVERLAEPQGAGTGDLALAMSPKYADALAATKARAAVVWADADWSSLGLEAAIVVPRARLAMAGLTAAFTRSVNFEGIHPTAIIHATATIGQNVHVGPYTIIAAGVQIDEGCWIGPQVNIDANSHIGAQTQIEAGVRIGQGVQIGARVALQPGVVIGADGFSFVTADLSNEERAFATAGRTPLAPPQDATRHKIHSLGSVVIGDDVDIGANSTVDAGTIRPTRVGRGTKIDNLVQVGHNVIVGEECVLCAQTAVAGSAVIGDRCVLGGKSGVKDNIRLGMDVVVGGAGIVLSDVQDGRFMMGYPAVEMPAFRAAQKALRKLVV